MITQTRSGGVFEFVLAAIFCLSAHAADIRYDIIPIWPEPGMAVSIDVEGINSFGDVVGYYDNAYSHGPFVYSDASGFQILPNRDQFGQPSVPNGINNSRQITTYDTGDLYSYSLASGYNHISELSTGHAGGDRGPHINNAGQISLTRDVLTPPGGTFGYLPQASIYTPGQGIQGVGFLNGNRTWANGLNNQGSVVGGSADDTGGSRQAFLWQSGAGITALNMREAFAINDNGEIAGVTDSLQPVVLRNGTLVPITLTSPFSGNLAINNHGVVVGSMMAGVYNHPFIWTDTEGTRDLNDLIDPTSGWTLRDVRGINDNGQIIGDGDFNGQTLVFRLDPTAVPEPGTWALFAIGCAIGWGFLRKRRDTKDGTGGQVGIAGLGKQI